MLDGSRLISISNQLDNFDSLSELLSGYQGLNEFWQIHGYSVDSLDN